MISTRYMHAVCAVALATAATISGARAQDPVTLEYWVYSDFAQGEALKLQQTFIEEFRKAHPNVTINISGKGDDDLTTGQVTGAASGNLPDVFMNGVNVGATLVEAGALKNIYAEFMAMPKEYRDSFDPALVAMCSPKPETMYCLPYTGYGSFMFRNLTVLKDAGVDTAAPIKDWADWLSQMEKVKASGKYAVPDQTQAWQSVVDTYSGVATPDEWGADFETKKTKVNEAKYAQTLQMFVDMQPYTSGTSRNDQATKDLFISNQLAFHLVGPWVNPTYAEAAKASGLKYDYVLVPGKTEGDYGGIKGYEFIGVAPNKNAQVAFEFAAYVTAKEQMLRWAKLLSRYNASAAAMADPSVASDPLIAITNKAAAKAIDGMPPYFKGAYPNCYRSILTDNAQAVADGGVTPQDGAKELVEELNECLAGG
ncbi:multiple sugar transport system substrate-binding protein [Mesorhizobium robiniae]|uniref:Multiple sugar transport system substrate-binding protein n=1 Tax=Mesorhizobium robiniae TaxID=559315 RepID=A0ABV2GSU7_9HYPH